MNIRSISSMFSLLVTHRGLEIGEKVQSCTTLYWTVHPVALKCVTDKMSSTFITR